MERRELYEPEDIEQLLIERPYNELLEMERAFVLRHLSGRDEYEAMRALLLKVHDDDAHMEPIDAEPSVRAHVLDVFRAEQRPQWRIWLNSVHAFLLPKEASAMWRPALALGSVALVAWLVVIGTGQMDEAKTPQLAELKETKETKNITDEKAANQKAQEPIASPQEEVRAEQEQPVVNTITFTDAVAADATADQPVVVHDLNATIASKAEVEESPAAPPPATEAQMDVAVNEELAKDKADAELEAITQSGALAIRLDTVSIAAGTATHYVTSNDLSSNYSLTNATPVQTVESVSATSVQRFAEREKAKKKEERKRSAAWDSGDADDGATADASAYIDLLRAAW
jgi:hypothetical protein